MFKAYCVNKDRVHKRKTISKCMFYFHDVLFGGKISNLTFFLKKDLSHRLGCLCDVEESDVEYDTESPWSHFIQAKQRCQQVRKIYQCTYFIGLNSRDYLLPTVPQVIIKLIHLEANKFSDINKFFKK